jgi:aspartate kinase
MSAIETDIIVQKFGGATLSTPEKIKSVAKRIHALHCTGKKIVVIVSAMGQTTNQLIELAHEVSARPPLREFDMLLSVGERISMSLVSMALNDLGCPAISFTGSQAGIITDDLHINANIKDIRAFRVREALADGKVVILAGFQGVSDTTKEITTLGRGGSDITAVAIAGYLNAARCEILKDVDSIYTADPRIVPEALPIRNLNYSQLLEMTQWGAKVLNYRSVKLASEKNVKLYVGPAHDEAKNEKINSGSFIFQDEKKISSPKPLAINSFPEVFEIELSHEFESFSDFQYHLQTSQIGEIHCLLKDEKKIIVTGPSESLKALKEFSKNDKKFSLKRSDLASVSLTYTAQVSDAELANISNFLSNSNIETFKAFLGPLSLHFILRSEDRIRCVKHLHTLCHSPLI